MHGYQGERSTEAGENLRFTYQKAKTSSRTKRSSHLKINLDQRSVENKAILVQ